MTNELYHHGIKGQKWGIRRYQNPDGSLTEAGKKRKARSDRYSRGKQISKEHSKIAYDKHQESLKNDYQYNAAYNEAMLTANRYGLDLHGRGGSTRYWTEDELERATNRYWNYTETYRSRSDALEAQAKRYADSEILKKYGDVGVSDMHYYDNINSAMRFGILAAFAAGGVAVKAIKQR
jgi:hypothetical protein